MSQFQNGKSGRGGSRKGAGRKSKYGVPTKTVRVPEELELRVQEFIDSLVFDTNSNEVLSQPVHEPFDFETKFKDELQRRIDDLLPRTAIKERAIAAKFAKKLVNS